MAFELTPEGISRLNLDEIRNLSENARRMGREDIVELCQAELEKRTPKNRRSRSSKAKNLEMTAADKLKQVADKINDIYDLSSAKVRTIKEGDEMVKQVPLLGKNRTAKVGGSKLKGQVVFERYISCSLNNQTYALNALLIEGENEADVQYDVRAPKDMLNNPVDYRITRPYLADDKNLAKKPLYVERFKNLEEGAEFFEELMGKIFPKQQTAKD